MIGTNKAGDKTIVLEAVCEVGQISLGDALVVGHADKIPDRDKLRQMFIYAANQKPLLREFRIQGAERCVNRPAPGGQGGEESSSDGDSQTPPPPPAATQ